MKPILGSRASHLFAPLPRLFSRSDAFLVGKPPGGPAPPPGKAGREVGPGTNLPVNFENGRLKVEISVILQTDFFLHSPNHNH